MSNIKWITIRQASELTDRQPRTIRYHLQKFKESKPSIKKLDNSIKYIQGDYDQSILMINEAFIFELYPSVKKRVAKGNAKGVQNDNDKGGAIAMQQTQPNVNEIEDLVQRRIKVMTEAHNRELENLKQAHADYLERLDKGAINMMNNHENEIGRLQQSNQQQIKQLSTDKQYLQLQLNSKDETMKILLEEMKQMRIERGNLNTDFVQIEEQKPINEIEEIEEIKQPIVKEEPKAKNIEIDIDEAIANGMTFTEWLELRK